MAVNTAGPGTGLEPATVGREMYDFLVDLYPICRSITGNGVRATLDLVKRYAPLVVHEVPSGTRVFDWVVPKEWNIQSAYVKGPKGEKILDFEKSNLHVVSYSVPVRKRMSLEELKEHLYTLPEHPDWIPYRTSYYEDRWGFCLPHNQFLRLDDGEYDVLIESSLKDGHLTYGEYLVRGRQSKEILVSTHICHPSLCNDNLSGVVLSTFLAKHLSTLSLRYSYRFLFVPGTIGAITWLAMNEEKVGQISHGLVAACVGDSGKFHYKKSRQGTAEIDRAVTHVLKHSGDQHEIVDFCPYGYDERQYCSPAFNLPVGSLTRTPHGRYPEYHTSADSLEFVRPESLGESFATYLAVFAVVEGNGKYLNLNPKCEPQLGRRGLYQAVGGQLDARAKELAMLWVLNFSDGGHDLLGIADLSGLKFEVIRSAADALLEHGLLAECAS